MIQTKLYYQFLSLSLKRNASQTFEDINCKNFFPSMYVIGTDCFRWMFFIPCNNYKTSFFIKIYHSPKDFFATAMLLRSLKQVLWKSVFYVRYLHTSLKPILRVQFKASTSLKPFLNKFYFWKCFLRSFVCENVPHISL